MRAKLKYSLPAAQMALAVALIWQSQIWYEAVLRVSDMPGPSPAFTLLIAVNAPIALPRTLWFRHVSYPWDTLTLIAAVGLLWYWVALNVDSWHKRKTVFMFAWKPLRLAGDLALIALGAFWGFVCLQGEFTVRSLTAAGFGLFHPWLRTPFLIAVVVCLLVWSVTLIYFLGRDLIQCAYSKNPTSR